MMENVPISVPAQLGIAAAIVGLVGFLLVIVLRNSKRNGSSNGQARRFERSIDNLWTAHNSCRNEREEDQANNRERFGRIEANIERIPAIEDAVNEANKTIGEVCTKVDLLLDKKPKR